MRKERLDDLLKRNILTQEEYNSFFKSMSVNEKGEMIGVVPNGTASFKYNLDGDMLGGNLLDFVLNEITPPYEAAEMDETFRTYGFMVCGIGDYWYWFHRDTITDYAREQGHKAIEEATEFELWKMIAIASRYWETFYKELYRYK